MVVRLARGVGKADGLADSAEFGADEFVAVGIDDLAKYRIVQLLCGRPEMCWDAQLYAECLGLRPVERTSGVLEELVERHILERRGSDGRPRYRLTVDRGMRRDLVDLFRLAETSVCRGRILARLAARSVERVKARVKERGAPGERDHIV